MRHKLFKFSILFLFIYSGYNFALADEVKIFKVQAAFIYQFTKYITWPDEANPSLKDNPFVISVIGKSPLYDELVDLSAKKEVKGRKLLVNLIKESSNLKQSNMIILTEPNESMLRELLSKVKGSDTLLVTQTEGFAEKGAMINFITEDEHLKFEINLLALKNQKIQVSAQLLNLAKLIQAKGN